MDSRDIQRIVSTGGNSGVGNPVSDECGVYLWLVGSRFFWRNGGIRGVGDRGWELKVKDEGTDRAPTLV